jgi:peptidoglycan/xylan/chitin deacetylase (PgdA/CDA1 family)
MELLLGAADLAFQIADAFGVTRRLSKASVVVLTYHGVSPGRSRIGQICPDAKQFFNQMVYLKRTCRILHPDEIGSALLNGRASGEKSVLITFDDGFRNNLTVVRPVLESLEIPAIFFVSTRHLYPGSFLWFAHARALFHRYPGPSVGVLGRIWSLGTTASRAASFAEFVVESRRRRVSDVYSALAAYPVESFVDPEVIDAEIRGIQASELGELSASSWVTVGGHTRNHPFLTQCQDQDLRLELEESKAELEKLCGRPVKFMAYPFGDYDPRVLQYVHDAGYELGFAVKPSGVLTNARYELSRTGIYRPGIGLLAAKVSGWYQN